MKELGPGVLHPPGQEVVGFARSSVLSPLILARTDIHRLFPSSFLNSFQLLFSLHFDIGYLSSEGLYSLYLCGLFLLYSSLLYSLHLCGLFLLYSGLLYSLNLLFLQIFFLELPSITFVPWFLYRTK